MNSTEIIIYTSSIKRGCVWIEIHNHGEQVGEDIDCKSRREAIVKAFTLAKEHNLNRFTEMRVHYVG